MVMQRAARLTDLDELAERVRDPGSLDYLVEAIDAHRGGAQRAAIVSTWVALTYDLMQKIRELAALGDAQAVQFTADVDRAVANSDVPKQLKIERDLLETARDRFELISPHEFQELARLREDRHLCAHPAFVSEDALLVYEQERTARGVIDFGDQIALAVEALRLPEVRAAYCDRYRFVLVDEYQDTNYAQSVMVKLLVQDWPKQSVCVVGDIRQAIYRFRGAARDNLLRFPEDFHETEPYSLRRNYRSTEQILDVANAIWADGAEDGGEDLVSVDGRQGHPVIACACEDPESEREWIARRIRAEHESGVAYRDMSVLVRKNEMKRQLWRGLIDRGIPAVMTVGTDLFRTPEVREILSYRLALSRPSDNVSLAHIASSDSFGLDEAALYDLVGPVPRDRSLFDMLVECAADPSAPNDLRLFLATFSRLLMDAAAVSPARVVERIIGLRRGAYTDLQRTNVYRFQAIAEDFASGRLRSATVGNFVAYLNLLLAAPSDEEEATDVTEEDAVHVLTVHGAKGLERKVVFVATASEQAFTVTNKSDPLPLRLRHPAAGMPCADDFPDKRRYKKALERWEKEQHRLEEQRIAYVALTRAKDQLYISWHRLPLW